MGVGAALVLVSLAAAYFAQSTRLYKTQALVACGGVGQNICTKNNSVKKTTLQGACNTKLIMAVRNGRTICITAPVKTPIKTPKK